MINLFIQWSIESLVDSYAISYSFTDKRYSGLVTHHVECENDPQEFAYANFNLARQAMVSALQEIKPDLVFNVSETFYMAISAKQIRQALVGSGVPLSAIDAAIDSMQEPQRTFVKIEWDNSTMFERNHPMIEGLGGQLGLSPQQIDGLFIGASAL
jgi:hypothetical protein